MRGVAGCAVWRCVALCAGCWGVRGATPLTVLCWGAGGVLAGCGGVLCRGEGCCGPLCEPLRGVQSTG